MRRAFLKGTDLLQGFIGNKDCLDDASMFVKIDDERSSHPLVLS